MWKLLWSEDFQWSEYIVFPSVSGLAKDMDSHLRPRFAFNLSQASEGFPERETCLDKTLKVFQRCGFGTKKEPSERSAYFLINWRIILEPGRRPELFQRHFHPRHSNRTCTSQCMCPVSMLRDCTAMRDLYEDPETKEAVGVVLEIGKFPSEQ